jgi:transcriptional regulator with XRE-family HTH domain
MTAIGERIRKMREDRNISQEKMALELNLTQSNYGRLEKDDKRLTVPKLQKISEVLKVSVSFLFNEQVSKVIHQHDNENPSAYNVENLYQNNKEISDKLIEQYEFRLKEKDELIAIFKTQIKALKEKNADLKIESESLKIK